MPSRTVSRVVEDKVERFTIWDNLSRHEAELREVGAVEADLAPLRAAARAVDEAEQADAAERGDNPHAAGGLEALAAPRDCANGWTIAPPTRVARRWAALAVMRVTGGRDPADDLALLQSILVGLWCLREWGAGNADAVMRAANGRGRLAELAMELLDAPAPAGEAVAADALAADYVALMGLEKKTAAIAAMAGYGAALASLRARFSTASTAGSSGSSPSPGTGSGSPGGSTP